MFLAITILLSNVTHPKSSKKDSGKNACMANLRQIESAVEQWAMDNGKKDGDTCTMEDLVPTYIKKILQCPSKGKYSNYGSHA